MAAKFPVSFEIANDDGDNTQRGTNEFNELVLGPFSRIPKLEFTSIEVGCEAHLTLNLRNPTDSLQCVVVIYPKDFIERGFSLNAGEFEIPPYSKVELEIRFKPVKELQCRDTIYIKDKFRNQKSQFQLTSRAITVNKKAPRKRKTWNVNKKPVVVPTHEGNGQIQSLPPMLDEVITAPAISVTLGGKIPHNSTLNVTFPVVPSTASTPTDKDATYCVKYEPVAELSTVFDDSLEIDHPQTETKEEVLEMKLSRTDIFTFDSVELNCTGNKENSVGTAKKRRMFDMSLSDIGFDNMTPDRTETRSILRSIENISHNTSTPKIAYTETTSYSIKLEPTSPQSCNRNHDDPLAKDENLGTSDKFKIKMEHTTPKVGSSRNLTASVSQPNPLANSNQVGVKTEPVTPLPSRDESTSAFKVPLRGAKIEVFTPIPQSESMRKLAIAFAISPPKDTLHSRRELFGKAAISSTPREKKPVVVQKQESFSHTERFNDHRAEESILSRSWNVKPSDVTAGQACTSTRTKKTVRGTTLSPKSLVAFKKSVRVHLPPKNLSRPSSAKSDPSSESFLVVDLYTNNFKEPVYNLDIYSATTMSDPFARCAIHPLEFREKQGQQLIKWVNSVLTPPEEYSAYEAGVDVASLWKRSVTSDSVPLPPSRESVSSKFHKNEMHLLNLRKTAHLIFKSTSVSETLYKIYSKIDVGYISVKDDIDLHSDQGARCHLVQMMMYYNPLWLRIGLEAIYGKDIPLQPRHTVIGLMHFIKNNLLSDKYITERNSYQNIQHLRMPKFKKEMNDFIVFKFLSLVFFLDIAKQKAIVPYDPCLFNKNSPIKESEGMINEFIKEFIKCVGHMKRNLTSMGFVVSHKQTAIDEYNFAVQTHLDLRDGASLTRLMEIILQKTQLISKLRLPAISRLQKIHNVKLAYNALMEVGVTIVDVLPNDVVDGHHEKIMSLLWQILHKFLKPRIEKGALVIQRWWKKKMLKIEITRRIQFKKQYKLRTSAVKIQSLWRGYYLRKNFVEIRNDLERQKKLRRQLREGKAAVTIQRWYRQTKRLIDDKKQHQLYLQEVSARKIQIWFRHTLAARKTKLKFMEKKRACMEIQRWYRKHLMAKKLRSEYLRRRTSAVVIQRWYRSRSSMRKQMLKYEMTRKAVVTIQQSYRALVAGRKQRTTYVLMRKSAVAIQRWFRATSAMKKQKLEFETTCNAIVTIQKRYRALVEGRKQRTAYVQMRKSAVAIQRWYRATSAMKKQKREYETTCIAIITIQQHYRALVEGRKQRTAYVQMKKSAVAIQRRYRATSAMRKQKLEYETICKSIVRIQQRYRALVEGRKQRVEYLLMKKSAVVIQRWYRASWAMKNQKREYKTTCKAIVTIQQQYRALLQGRKQRNEYHLMKTSAVVIQCWYRATSAMKKQKLEYETTCKAIVRIQQCYRSLVEGRKQRTAYVQMRKSAVTIQRRFRATSAMKKQKLEYATTYKAIVTIQQQYRALLQGRKQRNEYHLMRKSAVVIQLWYRATSAMKKQKLEYETTCKAIVRIQQHYRALVEGRKQRTAYVQMRKSAVAIQRRFRATSAMKKQKLEYAVTCKAVVTIQQRYRALVEGRKQRTVYIQMRKSAVAIQRRYRATSAMKKQKLEYETTRKAIVTIQQHYRALVQGRKQRNEYLLMRKLAVVIQRWYRASSAIKKQKLEYEVTCKAVMTIQRHYRATVAGRKQQIEYALMRKSAVVIQRWYRATSAMSKQKQEYKTTCKAIVTIQQCYRALVEGRKQRTAYVQMRKSAIAIQRRVRATSAMKKQKLEYENTCKAIVTIQQHYRALVERRKQRTVYVLMRKSAVAIQRWYRAASAMKKQKLEYENMYKAILTIQRHYRASVQGREQRTAYDLIRKSAIVVQRWYRAAAAKKKQELDLETKCKAVVTLQHHYRALLQGRKQRNEYHLMRKSAIVIQRWYRATSAMKKQKLEYEATCKAAVTIQRNYRALVAGRKQRIEYLFMKQSAIVIQRWYRSTSVTKKQKDYEIKRMAGLKIWIWYWRCKAARITRNNFLLFREKVIFVQRRVRRNLALKGEHIRISHVSSVKRSLSIDRMREVKETFVKITAAVKIQSWYRGIQYRRHQARMTELKAAAEKILNWYRLVIILRRDRRMFISQKQAAIKIQRCYRAYRQRVAQANEGASAPREEPRTLLQNYDRAIDFLLSPKVKTSLNWTYVSFKNLDFVTMYSPVLCEKLAEPACTKVYAVIFHFLDIESRSDAYQSVFGHGMNVLLHLTLHSKTYDAVWKNTLEYDGINVLLRLMGKFLEKKEELFCRAATLIWLLSRSPDQRRVIRENTEFVKRLTYYARKIVLGNKKVSVKTIKAVLPKVKSDWGYSGGDKEFPSRVDAIVALHRGFGMTL